MKDVWPVLVTTIVAAFATSVTVVPTLIWLARKFVGVAVLSQKEFMESALRQQQMLTEAAIESMKANTASIDANCRAVAALAARIERDGALREEKDKNTWHQLSRIEEGLKDLNRKR